MVEYQDAKENVLISNLFPILMELINNCPDNNLNFKATVNFVLREFYKFDIKYGIKFLSSE